MKVLTMKLTIITVFVALPSVLCQRGWMVPQEDGSFEYVSEETLRAYRWEHQNPPDLRNDNVRFYLHTAESGENSEEVSSSYPFNTYRETRFIIHGWKNDYQSDVNVDLRRAYQDTGLYNVIIVDWNNYAKRTYTYASNQVRDVAEQVATFIDKSALEVEKIAIIGHSLGAHCAGLAARYVTKGPIEAVWGLDPAGPLFSINDISWRISDSDAKYVECIHTNAGTLGFTEAIGVADYYVNGGSSQPGCGLDFAGSCSHSRSYAYFAESIRKNKFVSYRCRDYNSALKNQCEERLSSYENMGYGYLRSTGVYFTPVNDRSPYGKGV